MIYIILACLVLVLLSPVIKKNIASSKDWLALVPLVVAPFLLSVTNLDFSLLVQPLLITSFALKVDKNYFSKIVGLLPCFLLLHTELDGLYAMIQIAFFSIFYFRERSSVDLLFSTLLITSILITNIYISSVLLLAGLLIVLSEEMSFPKKALKRFVPILTILFMYKNTTFEVGSYLYVFYILLAVTYLRFTHKENLLSSNVCYLLSVFIFLVPGTYVLSFVFLSIVFSEVLNIAIKTLEKKYEIKFDILKLVRDGFVLSPGVLLLFLFLNSTSQYYIVPLMISLVCVMTLVKYSYEVIMNKNTFWSEVASVLVLLLLLFPFNSIPTKFLFLIDQTIVSSLEWNSLSVTYYVILFLSVGMIGFIKFKFNLKSIFYKYDYSSRERSKYYTKKMSYSFGSYNLGLSNKGQGFERNLGLEFLLLVSEFVTKRFSMATWLIILGLIFTMVYSV